MSEVLAAALEYHARGLQPVVAPLGGKSPTTNWKQWQDERITERLLRLWFNKPSNIFLVTGSVSRHLVLDCDDDKAVEYWHSLIGDVLDRTALSTTGKGRHYHFKLPVGVIVRNRSVSDATGKWDIRAEGGGVVAPPSVHENGRKYEWVRNLDHWQDCPEELLRTEVSSKESGGEMRSLLVGLLENVESHGGRNNWLTAVAGHYAKWVPYRDAYDNFVWEAARRLDPPLDEAEIQKVADSVWKTEQAKQGKAPSDLSEDGADAWRRRVLQPREDTGWLCSGGTHILVQTKSGKGDESLMGVSSWCDCDVRVLGVIKSEEEQTFRVELRFPDGDAIEDNLSSATLADGKKLSAWLFARGASIGPPDNMWPRTMFGTARLMRYLKAQGAPEMEAADALGWHRDSGAFITHEGIIRATGPSIFEHVRPDPAVRGWAPYRYGHTGIDAARAILGEVLTFHDEMVASVFGAWWATVFLKPQIQERVSQFPFMALEAPSESGKTTGFFALMLQLAGSTAGQSNPTRAALRDYLSAHHNGIVWVDDLDDLDDLGELLRQVTVGGSFAKKGDGNHTQVVATMRSALVVSGESLGLHDQKALVDRAVLLDVPSPTGRRSVHGDYPQWDDIIRLRTTYPDLTEFAGSLVELALQQEEIVYGLKNFRVGAGRHADVLAILRVGARILREMLGGDSGLVDRVDEWCHNAADAYTGNENALTLRLIPAALAYTGWKTRPEAPDQMHRQVATPVFIHEKDDTVWFSPQLLAEWWKTAPRGGKKIQLRVESKQALEQQARDMGLGGRKNVSRKAFRLDGARDIRHIYWQCGEELSAELLRRSRGMKKEDEDAEPSSQLLGS